MDNQTPEIIVLKFADSAVPVFKESRNRDYIKYGENNLYPEYLTHLYDKSAKHNAIINGKANYIFGNGYENGDVVVNRLNQSLNDISKRAILDRIIYGGFKLEIIWGFNRKISEIYHIDYNTIRKGKEGGFYYKESWDLKICRDDEKFIPSFDPSNPVGSQIFEYNEYRPGIRFYPLPDYIGSNNYIETDIEISKFHLSAIRNGMMPSKMIQFFTGNPTDDAKRDIEQRFKKKYAGAENGGQFLFVFNQANAQKSVEVNDLSASELDKQFDLLNKTCQQEIFSGHSITSPMLFGIKTEGQLGGSTELKVAYSIFQNTYSKPKAADFDREINWLLGYSNFPGIYELRPSDPIGIQFDAKDFINILPKEFVLNELGVPKDMREGETVTPSVVAPQSQGVSVNDNIKNLTAKQKQGIYRIIRDYNNPEHPTTWAQAALMLKSGYGLNDEDVKVFLGEEPAPLQMSFSTDDEIISLFDSFGDSKNDYEILKSKKVGFYSELECEADEEIFIKEAFLTYDVTATENKIIELIKKDERITPEVIAETIKETPGFVKSKINSLISRGYIETAIEKIGTDEIIKRVIPKGLDILKPPVKSKINPTQVYIKYSYEGPQDARNRPFCAKLMQLNRLYSRFEIEKISERLGYSVFDRRGGFWNKGGTILPHCRHNWQSNVIIKKGGN